MLGTLCEDQRTPTLVLGHLYWASASIHTPYSTMSRGSGQRNKIHPKTVHIKGGKKFHGAMGFSAVL